MVVERVLYNIWYNTLYTTLQRESVNEYNAECFFELGAYAIPGKEYNYNIYAYGVIIDAF